jgi:hypothetical protein
VETAIGGLVFDSSGVLYGISLTSSAQLYTIDIGSGAATAAGPLGIGTIFEGGLAIDDNDLLYGVEEGSTSNAQTFTIDPSKVSATIIGPIPGDARDLNGMAFDGAILYAIDGTSGSLGYIDLTVDVGAYKQLYTLSGYTVGSTGGLAVDPDTGTLYAAFEDGTFCTLDKSSGTVNKLGTTTANYGLAFAPLTALNLYGTDGNTLYEVDESNGSSTPVGTHGTSEEIGGMAFGGDGTLYGIGPGPNPDLYTIDKFTGLATLVGPLGVGFVFEGGLEFDAMGMLFGVDQGNPTDAKTMTIDTLTGTATIVGPFPGDARDLNGLAFDGTAMYAIDGMSNTLGTIDLATGGYTQIGNTQYTIGQKGGLAFDPSDGTLYASFSDGGFYTIDKFTGLASPRGTTLATNGLAFERAAKSLTASVATISAATGGAADFTLAAGPGNANRTYLLLGSITGTVPGTPLPGGMVILPLNWDIYTNFVFSMINTPIFAKFLGKLKMNGVAFARFDTLGPLPSAMIGVTMSYAYAVNNPWNYASNAVSITIVP